MKKIQQLEKTTIFQEADTLFPLLSIATSLRSRACVCVCALGEGNDGALSFCLPLLLLAGGRDGPSAGELEGRGFEVDAAVLGVGVKDAPPKESTSSLPRSRLCERRRLAGKTRHFCIDFEANSDSRRRGASRSSEAATRIRKEATSQASSSSSPPTTMTSSSSSTKRIPGGSSGSETCSGPSASRSGEA